MVRLHWINISSPKGRNREEETGMGPKQPGTQRGKLHQMPRLRIKALWFNDPPSRSIGAGVQLSRHCCLRVALLKALLGRDVIAEAPGSSVLLTLEDPTLIALIRIPNLYPL